MRDSSPGDIATALRRQEANTANTAVLYSLFSFIAQGATMKYLSINEVARDYLKVSRSTIYRLINQGEFQLVHVRGCARIPAQSLSVYMEHLEQEAF